jgi:hypothetical protein
MRWALYFLAEYANMFVVASVAATLFLGGWLRPFLNVNWLAVRLDVVFPVALFGASAVLIWRMVGWLIDPVQRKILLVVVRLLVFVGGSRRKRGGHRPLLVPAENLLPALRQDLVPRHLSPLPLRPAHEHRLEGDDSPRHGRGGGESSAGNDPQANLGTLPRVILVLSKGNVS